MLCDICQSLATTRCAECGAFACADHCGVKCLTCSGDYVILNSVVEIENVDETSVYTTDREPQYAGKGYLQSRSPSRMETIYIDDPGPPECDHCGGLAKQICNNCHQLYCSQHEGAKNLCVTCAKSARLGVWVLVACLALLGLAVLMSRFLS